MTELAARLRRPLLHLGRPTAASLALAALLVAGLAVAYAVRAHGFDGKALPGVRVAGVDVSGLSRADAAIAVKDAVAPRLARTVTVSADGHRIPVPLGSLFRLDADATAAAALRAGRGSLPARAASLLSPVTPKREVAPVLRLRRVAAGGLAAELDRFGAPAVPARVTLNGLSPVVTPSRDGRRVSQTALFEALERSVVTGDSSVDAFYRRAVPSLSNAAAIEAARTIRIVLSAPVVLRFHGRDLGELSPDRLARLLRLDPTGGRIVVRLDEGPLVRLVRPRLAPWRHRATNARFAVSGPLVHVVPSRPGYDVDPASVAGAVTAAAYSRADRAAELTLGAIPADLTTREANALGIRRELVSYTTEMGPSSSNRIHNVHLMANFIDGTIVKSGETFSFNKVVGPRTAERGFLEGQMIVGSLLLPAIGGGVCQTATTLFNDAFEAGLPILQRTNHNFYLSHYPLGRDATVSWGGPDLVFRNDLKHAILIKSSYTDSTLTFTFYGTPQARRVLARTGPETNFRGPTMSYALDPSAPPGSVQVVGGSGASGFDVAVFRTVYEHGRVRRKDSFKSSYIPQGPTTVYGPGRTPPSPYIVLPSHP